MAPEHDDELAAARKALGEIVRGNCKRNAGVRLRAAELILGKKLLEQISDEDLLAEVKRRNEAATKTNAA